MTNRFKHFEEAYKIRREALKKKRELRKEALGGSESAMQRVYDEATKTRRAIKIEAGLSKSKGEETSIEKFVEDFLVELGIPFKKQKRIRYINVDFFIPSINLVVEIHGCYWHACPKCYPAGPKNDIQKKNILKNERMEEFVSEAKYDLFIVWDHDIKNNPEELKKNLKESILNGKSD